MAAGNLQAEGALEREEFWQAFRGCLQRLSQRLQVRMHLMMCRLCSGFARQIRLLRRAARENPEGLGPDENSREARLSDEARERIKAALQDGDESSHALIRSG